jgi:hypothetical protein
MTLHGDLICHVPKSASGDNASTTSASPVLKTGHARVARAFFPPDLVCEVKALACQLPQEYGQPLSRFSRTDLQRLVVERGLVAQISGATIWRWLHEDALRPWTQRSWVLPRASDFAAKAGVVLDLYHRLWQDAPLGPDDYVLSADEKTQLQIRERLHPTQAPGPNRPIGVDDRYRRHGTCTYLAAWDVHFARLFGQMIDRSTIVTFDAFVASVMDLEPYRSAHRVFWVVDNGTVHRGARACQRLQNQWPQLVLVHLPVHASWLNQIEVYFSVLQRKALTPDDFATRQALEERVMGFQEHYQQVAAPFTWHFTRDDLHDLLARCDEQTLARAA